MVGLPDILALLDRWDAWKALKEAPAKIAALEERIAALEAKGADPEIACPRCGKLMTWMGEAPHPAFGRMGAKNETRRCEGCDIERTIMRKPRA